MIYSYANLVHNQIIFNLMQRIHLKKCSLSHPGTLAGSYPQVYLSLYGPAWALAKILAKVCGQIGTYRFPMLFLIVLNPQVCKYVDSTEITSVC